MPTHCTTGADEEFKNILENGTHALYMPTYCTTAADEELKNMKEKKVFTHCACPHVHTVQQERMRSLRMY